MNLRPSGYEPDELPAAPSRDVKLVEGAGFEPAKSSTADLQSAPFSHSGIPPYKIHGAGEKNRTPNLLITSQLLYQLSYASAENIVCCLSDETYYIILNSVCQHLFIYFFTLLLSDTATEQRNNNKIVQRLRSGNRQTQPEWIC